MNAFQRLLIALKKAGIDVSSLPTTELISAFQEALLTVADAMGEVSPVNVIKVESKPVADEVIKILKRRH